MGLLKLADKYTSERLEAACMKALTFTPRPSLKNIQAILSSGQDKAVEESTEKSSESKYGFTRGAEYYGGIQSLIRRSLQSPQIQPVSY